MNRVVRAIRQGRRVHPEAADRTLPWWGDLVYCTAAGLAVIAWALFDLREDSGQPT